jgi:uncharacterized membrane protein
MRMNDRNAEQIIGQLLRAGVLLSAFVVLVGGVFYLRQAAHAQRDFHTFHGVTPALKTISGVVQGAARFDPESVIQLGLLLLIATPVARVAFSVAAFALERDWLYVGLTLMVLGVLLFSLLQST